MCFISARAQEWDKFWGSRDFGITPTKKNLFKKFKEIGLSKNAKVLEVGCGSGTLTHFWKEMGCEIIGLDISDKALEITSRKSLQCVKGDAAEGLPFRNYAFDLVYSDGLLEHFIDSRPILEEIFRVSGRYVLTIVPRISPYKWIHNLIMRPPKEYKKKDREWIELHKEFNLRSIKTEKVRFGLLWILCTKREVD